MEMGAILMTMMERNYTRWIPIGEKPCRWMHEEAETMTGDD
jgi:hypothetical protein